jgi:N-acetyl-alpha-D-muramate 1-phosphate uridylyltransferase
MRITEAMVLAAGLGTRMRPVTDTIPKPLVPIGGRPMIDIVLALLRQAGVSRVAINVHYLAEQMLAHVQDYPGLEILISDERDRLMNSGGGLAKGLKLLGREPVLVMNADLFWCGEASGEPSNLERLGSAFDPENMDMLLLCVRNEDTTGHNGKLDFSLSEDGRLSRYRPEIGEPVVYAGAIVLSPSLFDGAPQDDFNLNLYFDRAIAANRLFGLMLQGHWITVGTPDAIGAAEAALTRFGSGGS